MDCNPDICYAFQWTKWNIEERLNLLDLTHIHYEFFKHNFIIKAKYNLSGGQQEIFNWVIDPTYPIKLYMLDNETGKQVLNLFVKFWHYKYGDENE